MATERKLDVDFWDYQKVYNTFVRPLGGGGLDATDFIEILEERRSNGYKYFFQTDENGRLERLSFEMDDAMQSYALGGDENVLLFDPTFGTNKYGLQLSMFTAVAETGATVILFVCLFRSGDENTFKWCFKCFHDTFRVAPSYIFTDGDPAIAGALQECKSIWPNTYHALCVYHLFQNFFKHLHCLYAKTHDKWTELCRAWWKLAKDSDIRTCDSFDDRFDAEILNHVKSYSNKEASTYNNAIKWLASLKAVCDGSWLIRRVSFCRALHLCGSRQCDGRR